MHQVRIHNRPDVDNEYFDLWIWIAYLRTKRERERERGREGESEWCKCVQIEDEQFMNRPRHLPRNLVCLSASVRPLSVENCLNNCSCSFNAVSFALWLSFESSFAFCSSFGSSFGSSFALLSSLSSLSSLDFVDVHSDLTRFGFNLNSDWFSV